MWVVTCACGEQMEADSENGVRYLLARHMRESEERRGKGNTDAH